MPTDRINQILILKEGRRLGYAEYGAPGGRQVFHFHGSASSRLDHPADESLLCSLNIRFISVERPGHGLSDFQPGRRLLDWPEDIRQLADHLGLAGFYVAGHSAGGPHALACAHQLPDRVIAGAVISGVAPMNRPGAYTGLPLNNQVLAKSARWFPPLTRLIRRMMRGMVMGDAQKTAQRLMASIPETDKSVLYAPQYVEIFVSSIREGLRPGWQGVAMDDILINREWGFDPAGVKPRIDIWHGEADVNVPVHAARYLGERLPHNRVTLLPGEGHFFLLRCWGQILSALVEEGGGGERKQLPAV